MKRIGEIYSIKGSLVVGSGIKDIKIGEVVEIGEERIIGEVVKISGEKFFVQVYESVSMLRCKEKIYATGKMLVAELGPGLVSNVFDGIERSLINLKEFIERGFKVFPLERKKKWKFKPIVEKNSYVNYNDVIGIVQETSLIKHKILVPFGIKGKVVEIEEGEFRIEDTIAKVKDENGKVNEIKMYQQWPIRIQRPFKERLPLNFPMITGQRVIDVFFPIAKGGSACIPGGFGTGKTVLLQTLTKFSDVDLVVYVGCGERGNEICELLTEFPEFKDPRTNEPLMDKSIIIANTSNMPVVAREASVYIGATLAEYFRDMGLHVALFADSTSRWAEALREISGRLGEMPAEKGYPAYLPNKIAEFYERAGYFKCLGNPERIGSLTVIGSVSPPGGDFNEPVTIHTLRFTGTFWALDTELAYSRHFPAINWLKSYSLYNLKFSSSFIESQSQYEKNLESFWKEILDNFDSYKNKALNILSEASELESIARVIGEASLPDDQRVILLAGEIIKEGFLRQNAYSEKDAYCDPKKQVLLLKLLIDFIEKAYNLVKSGMEYEKISKLDIVEKLKRIKEEDISEIEKTFKEIEKLS